MLVYTNAYLYIYGKLNVYMTRRVELTENNSPMWYLRTGVRKLPPIKMHGVEKKVCEIRTCFRI